MKKLLINRRRRVNVKLSGAFCYLSFIFSYGNGFSPDMIFC